MVNIRNTIVSIMDLMNREPVYYTADFKGMDVEQSPLYLQALYFDGEDNGYGAQLISPGLFSKEDIRR